MRLCLLFLIEPSFPLSLQGVIMTIRTELGRKIKQLRIQAGLTQEEFAEAVNIESPSYISKIEKGDGAPSYELLERIAHALKLELRELFDLSSRLRNSKITSLDRWTLKFKTLLKSKSEVEIKNAYYILRKYLDKK